MRLMQFPQSIQRIPRAQSRVTAARDTGSSAERRDGDRDVVDPVGGVGGVAPSIKWRRCKGPFSRSSAHVI